MPTARLTFFARRRQRIAAAPFPELSIFQVRAGSKRIGDGRHAGAVAVGEFGVVAPGQLLHVRNLPAPDEPYRSVCLCIPQALLETITVAPASEKNWAILPSSRPLAQAFAHVEQGAVEQLHDSLMRHRVAELLAAVALAGFQPSMKQTQRLAERVRLLLSSEPAREWRADDAAGHHALSTATLRRRLAEEGTGFREILEEVRITHALALVQGSDKPLKLVAAECGYASPSRFTARFRQRFGTLPSQLRD